MGINLPVAIKLKVASLIFASLATGAFLGMTIPLKPALAKNPYQICAENLVAVGISEDTTAEVCAGALEPEILSECVSKISDSTLEGVDPPLILFNCQRVRRPEELGNCVVDILENIPDASKEIVMESCRRSLLPERYASCAIGLYEQLQLPSTEIFVNCLNPKDVVLIELGN